MNIARILALARLVRGTGGGSGGDGWDGNYIKEKGESVIIGKNSFAENEYLKTVFIADCVDIQDTAFCRCNNLTDVALNNLTNKEWRMTGLGAFQFCENLKTVQLSNIRIVGENAFADCTNLQTVSLDGYMGLASDRGYPFAIGKSAFHNCSKLSIVTESIYEPDLPIYCETVGEGAFHGCSMLTKIGLQGCNKIDSNAFYGCSSLTTVILYSGLCEIAFDSFLETPIMTGTGHLYVYQSVYEQYRAVYEPAFEEFGMPGFFDIMFRKIEDYPEICG